MNRKPNGIARISYRDGIKIDAPWKESEAPARITPKCVYVYSTTVPDKYDRNSGRWKDAYEIRCFINPRRLVAYKITGYEWEKVK